MKYDQPEEIQKALLVIIRATISRKINWHGVNVTKSPRLLGNFDMDFNEISDRYEGEFAGLHLSLFKKSPTDISMGVGVLGERKRMGEIVLDIEDASTNESWRVPYSHRIDELMLAVKQNTRQQPPTQGVIDRIINATS